MEERKKQEKEKEKTRIHALYGHSISHRTRSTGLIVYIV